MSGAERTKSAEKNLQARNAMQCDAMQCVLALCHEFGALCNRMHLRTFGFKAKLRVWFARVNSAALLCAAVMCRCMLHGEWRCLFQCTCSMACPVQHGSASASAFVIIQCCGLRWAGRDRQVQGGQRQGALQRLCS
jgi:hypothetical protein